MNPLKNRTYTCIHIIPQSTKLNICKSTRNGMNETKLACGEICFTDVKWYLYLRPMINRQNFFLVYVIFCK
jgi:hypothetical protein